ncbi:hypothetical protein C6W92_14700 [Roseovarius sp. A46]|mgnify:CR=1 FL=1|jgi:hypothetical protein|uniref:DUF6173 family protein n=1 Tax=Roseovarius sp. A46 TaxID=2109331 RepID=UPI000E9B89A6|nr:DUF6173 family protein [Roseovarius sp. A46]RXV59664.1 hypothetical protein C6W92_14700 [Roseovarius sp. A46]HAW49297.1 hypothetical protein [Roseovarius sp.]|tara:strand:- start:363 stop:815 length:453 start_codon:yes stop_codon:yes gene_type:complete
MTDRIETTAEHAEAAAMPRAHEVHSKPGQPCIETAAKALKNGPAEDKSPARWAYERLILYIRNFEETLDEAHEVAMGFAGSDAGTIHIEGMGYFDPDIVTFYGQDQLGMRTQLVQHVSQLSVMLRALPKQVEEAPPTRIGFRLAQDIEAE